MYLSSDEFLDLERARLTLRAHGIGADRGRLVREALALLMTDLEAGIDASVIAKRLRAASQPDPAGDAPVANGAPVNGGVANGALVDVGVADGARVNGGLDGIPVDVGSVSGLPAGSGPVHGLLAGGGPVAGVLASGVGAAGPPEGPQ